VPLEQVFSDVSGDDGLVLFQGVEVTIAHPGGDFETDVEQLPEARVESFALGIMAQRRNQLR
jgi:hypothetical protein